MITFDLKEYELVSIWATAISRLEQRTVTPESYALEYLQGGGTIIDLEEVAHRCLSSAHRYHLLQLLFSHNPYEDANHLQSIENELLYECDPGKQLGLVLQLEVLFGLRQA